MKTSKYFALNLDRKVNNKLSNLALNEIILLYDLILLIIIDNLI